MRITPQPIVLDPEKWGAFKGVKRIDLNDLGKILPGFRPLDEMQLCVSGAQIPGQMTFAELAVVVAVVRGTGAKSFAQIGTFDGLTVRNLLDNCPELQSLVTVDLPESLAAAKGTGSKFGVDHFNAAVINKTMIGYRYREHPRSAIVRDIRTDSALLKPEDFPDPPEIFFIDGNHSYDYCASDTKIAHRVLARPGLLIWHDFGQVEDLPGVTRALTELADDGTYSLYWLKGYPSTTLVFGVQNGK